MNVVKTLNRKSMIIRPSGRSTDFISPSFGYGCLYNCSYCYMKRHKAKGLDIAENTSQILSEINSHASFDTTKKPNQTHEKYTTYDISCNEDFALHAKFHNWREIFDFFKNHPVAMGSFATKCVNKKLLEYNPDNKIRIRFSLMPEEYRQILEPNTNTINERLSAVKLFRDAGYEVHLNFSPVIVVRGWRKKYYELFNKVKQYAQNDNWDNTSVKSEVIFLTHNQNKHRYNLENDISGEDMLWMPEIQETKISQYGGRNIRYRHDLKARFIKDFKLLHSTVIPWNKIRYIF